MIHKTLSDAQSVHSTCSWKQLVIVTVTLSNGIKFFRTYLFNAITDKCKRCRKARNQCRAEGADHGRHRIASSGHTCEICGNPFAAFARHGRLGRRLSPDNPHATNWHSLSDGGRLH